MCRYDPAGSRRVAGETRKALPMRLADMTMLKRTTIAVLAGMFAMAAPVTLPAQAQDAAELTVRTNRLENQLRQLSGQIEQLQFENRRLTEQLRKFQEDVEFRLNERNGARPPGGQPAQQPQRRSRNDAFDPNAQAAAPGAPRPLGAAPADAGVPGTGQPLDLSGAARTPPGAPLNAAARSGPSVAATTTQSPRELYTAAQAALTAQQYESAEMSFRQFLQANPRNQLTPAALYGLGESYFRRNRHRDAAEQYLKVTTDHQRSGIAPEALLRLGQSLNALGAKDQACATFAQVNVRYPEAPANVRQGVEREQRRAGCAG
jgi:tol-pal system protein YbgF